MGQVWRVQSAWVSRGRRRRNDIIVEYSFRVIERKIDSDCGAWRKLFGLFRNGGTGIERDGPQKQKAGNCRLSGLTVENESQDESPLGKFVFPDCGFRENEVSALRSWRGVQRIEIDFLVQPGSESWRRNEMSERKGMKGKRSRERSRPRGVFTIFLTTQISMMVVVEVRVGCDGSGGCGRKARRSARTPLFPSFSQAFPYLNVCGSGVG